MTFILNIIEHFSATFFEPFSLIMDSFRILEFFFWSFFGVMNPNLHSKFSIFINSTILNLTNFNNFFVRFESCDANISENKFEKKQTILSLD